MHQSAFLDFTYAGVECLEANFCDFVQSLYFAQFFEIKVLDWHFFISPRFIHHYLLYICTQVAEIYSFEKDLYDEV